MDRLFRAEFFTKTCKVNTYRINLMHENLEIYLDN